MNRSFYSAKIDKFLEEDAKQVLGKISSSNPFELSLEQKNAWEEEISILKSQLKGLGDGYIMFEYSIPRMGKRADVVILYKSVIFILEFKVGDSEYKKSTYEQVWDYALDIKYFQSGCSNSIIAPIMVPTEANEADFEIVKYHDGVLRPIGANRDNIYAVITKVACYFENELCINISEWNDAVYMPSPTIIEAAKALYSEHQVQDITRSDAGAKNLTITTSAVERIIKESKEQRKKSIVFVTGVPGAGKTLVGLNLASKYHDNDEGLHAVFLSGNLPLVKVLQEALARDKVARLDSEGQKISKAEAIREIKSFIQIIHTYRDEYVLHENICPAEHIAIFDEAQRCWTKQALASFMSKKKGIKDFAKSEPEFLISTMERFGENDWAVIVCLVGGGQEINSGEAGMPEWFDSLRFRLNENKIWDVYTARNIDDEEYLRGKSWQSLTQGLNVHIDDNLYLSSSMRSFRTELVSQFVKQMLDNKKKEASITYTQLKERYPIVLTRDIEIAKKWVKEKCRGTERGGILSSSSAKRLRPNGVFYSKNEISPENWFLNSQDDLRSSSFLEVVASEFETQGLEIDYAIVAWDLDFKLKNGKWKAYEISMRKDPPDWSPIKNEERICFLKNAYRVLLTRARQGFIIFIPKGSEDDVTRRRQDYDEIFNYLCSIGISVIDK